MMLNLLRYSASAGGCRSSAKRDRRSFRISRPGKQRRKS